MSRSVQPINYETLRESQARAQEALVTAPDPVEIEVAE